MKLLLFGLSLAGVASAQIQVNGFSMVPASQASMMPAATAMSPAASATSSAAASSSSSTSMAASSATPQNNSGCSNGQCGGSNNQYGGGYNQYGGGYAPPSTYTPAPAMYSPPATTQMSYESFKNGGYKSMDCGYGWQKANDGSCQQQTWVRALLIWHILFSRLLNRRS